MAFPVDAIVFCSHQAAPELRKMLSQGVSKNIIDLSKAGGRANRDKLSVKKYYLLGSGHKEAL